tara:strand:+ start:143 stop:520 length:378 start_codon:yes stop_codon:yes gene_type:complete
MALKQNELIKIVEKILSLDDEMRFVAIIDLKGNIIEGIMKSGKTSLESQKQEELFCKQVSDRRKVREAFNDELGKVRYVNVEREKVTQLVVYSKKKTIFVTMEPEITFDKKSDIVKKIKKLTSNL